MLKNKKMKVALLMNRNMGNKMFHPSTLEYLHSFADIQKIQTLPDIVDGAFMKDAIKGAEACITSWGTPKLTDEVLENAPDLKVIGHTAGSIRNFITETVWERNIHVFSATPVMAVDVAETVLGLIIISLKRIWQIHEQSAKGLWRTYSQTNKHQGHPDVNKQVDKMRRLNRYTTIGIIGASSVGRSLIHMLKPFEVRILLYDPYVDEVKARELGVVKTSLEELMAASDVVTVQAPDIPETHHMIHRKNLALLQDDAIFINTARGALVDEEALIDELKTGRIFACIDVTDPEPPVPGSPLYTMGNVILTPHVAGGQTINGRYEHGQYVVDEINCFFHTGVLKYEITKKMMEVIA